MIFIFVAVTAVAFLAVAALVSNIVEEFLVSQRIQQQTKETARAALEIVPAYAQADAQAVYALVLSRAQSMDGRLLLLDRDAVVQVDSASQHNGFRVPFREVRDVLVRGVDAAHGFHRITRTAENVGLLAKDEETVWAVYYAAPLIHNGERVGVILFSSLIQDVENSVREVIGRITLIFVLVCVGITFVSLLLSNWLTKPIAELTAAIRTMGRKGGARVQVHGAGEMVELGNAFNRMSEQIEAHDRVRDEFVANASHELKTPLSAMKILSESMLYQDEPDPAMAKEFFADINSEVDRLTRIVSELLRLVQEDTTDAPLEKSQGRLDILVERVMARLQPIAAQKGIALTCDLAPTACEFEPMRMEQVAVNLIENAIKYTDEGAVSVTVAARDGQAEFSVTDTGIGVPNDAIPKLFERFFRVDKARSRGTGGTGLGLSIVKEIVERHGGTIQVQSVLGEGSVFTVRIPMGKGGASV